ncbi:MAG TPA: aldo/keto reductase [Polyangiaceae bacterium]
MRKRPLGKTGLFVSEMSLGTWGLSGDGYGHVDEGVAEAVIARCIEMGMNLVETADAYGGGKMEALLGRVLANKDVFVVTKGGTDRTTDPPRKRFEGDYLRERVQSSLKRLKRDRLDVYLLHNPSIVALGSTNAVETMQALVKEGLIAHWGVSASSDEVARLAIEKGAEVIELAYNLFQGADLHRIAGDIMVAGTGVLARSVLSHGLLSGYWPKDREFPEGDHRSQRWTKLELEQRVNQLDAVRFLVRGDVYTMRAAAVRFVMANSLVSSAVLGPRSVEQAEQLVRETGGGPRYLSDEQLSQLPRSLQKMGILT